MSPKSPENSGYFNPQVGGGRVLDVPFGPLDPSPWPVKGIQNEEEHQNDQTVVQAATEEEEINVIHKVGSEFLQLLDSFGEDGLEKVDEQLEEVNAEDDKEV